MNPVPTFKMRHASRLTEVFKFLCAPGEKSDEQLQRSCQRDPPTQTDGNTEAHHLPVHCVRGHGEHKPYDERGEDDAEHNTLKVPMGCATAETAVKLVTRGSSGPHEKPEHERILFSPHLSMTRTVAACISVRGAHALMKARATPVRVHSQS